jgi:hypothetical protein
MTGKWIATRLPAKPRTRAVIGALALVGAALVALGTAAPAYAATGTHLSSSPAAVGGGGTGDNHSLNGTASASAHLSSAPDCVGGGGTGTD